MPKEAPLKRTSGLYFFASAKKRKKNNNDAKIKSFPMKGKRASANERE